jgi:acyl-CoA thioesterase-1
LKRFPGKPALTLAVPLLLMAWVALATPSVAQTTTILAFGDSLTAGLGLGDADSFPSQLEKRLRAEGRDVRVINAGVSGDTTSMGLARLDWVLGDETPALVILELGANDALRGQPPEQARQNLQTIIEDLKARNIPILLAGMMAPRNLGPDYVTAFDAIYPALAKQYDLAFYPFFMEGVIDHPGLIQDDGLHPTPEGVAVIVENMLPLIQETLDRDG